MKMREERNGKGKWRMKREEKLKMIGRGGGSGTMVGVWRGNGKRGIGGGVS